MGNVSSVGARNGQVPGFQEGGKYSQKSIDEMDNGKLIDLSQSGGDVDKNNAMAELKERFFPGEAEQSDMNGGDISEKGGCGNSEMGGDIGGGDGEIDDDITKILRKLLRGEPLTPEQKNKLKAAMGTDITDASIPPTTSTAPAPAQL